MQQGVHILAVDDGHQVTPAASGEAALAQLAQRKFDLIITDFSMPGMHGDQLVAHVRKLVPNQPIIMATGFVEEYNDFGQASGGVDALLLKPFSHKDLREAIEKALPHRHPDYTSGLAPIIKPAPTPAFFHAPEA